MRKWHQLEHQEGIKIIPRESHTAVLYNSSIYILGGSTYANDFLQFDIRTGQWKELYYENAPTRRNSHTAVIYKDEMIVFGGLAGKYLNDVHVFNFEKQEWKEMVTSGEKPSGRANSSAVVYKGRMYIFGGFCTELYLNDCFVLHIDDRLWVKNQTLGDVPSKRTWHTAVIYFDSMIVFGGFSNGEYCNDIHALNLNTNIWKTIECVGCSPAPRCGHSCVEYQGKMYIFGGYGEMYFDDFWEFDFQTRRWERIEARGKKPSERELHKAVVNSDGTMFVFGGACGAFYAKKNDMFSVSLSVQMFVILKNILDNGYFGDINVYNS